MKLNFAQVKTIKLVCCGQGFNQEYKSHYNRYKVLITGTMKDGTEIESVPIERIYDKKELINLAYWVNRSSVMAMTCWGTSQEFEAQLALGNFFEVDKEDRKNWSEYCKKLKDKIEAIY